MVKGSAGDKEPAIEQEFDRIGTQTKHTHTHTSTDGKNRRWRL